MTILWNCNHSTSCSESYDTWTENKGKYGQVLAENMEDVGKVTKISGLRELIVFIMRIDSFHHEN